MARMTCIIVDDDVFSTKIMSGYICRTNDVSLTQAFSNAIDAINFLSSNEGRSVDIIFLDIEMPEMSGIEFMRAIDLAGKEVVIYSSQEKYALESYEYNVCDYLLKPVSYARFIRAVGKARQALEAKGDVRLAGETVDGNATSDRETVYLKDNTGGLHKVKFEDIIMMEAQENYVAVSTPRQRLLVHMPLKKVIELFPPEAYIMRIHRSYAIGVRHVCNIDKDKVFVECGEERLKLPLSRTYCQTLRRLMRSLTTAEDSDQDIIAFQQ